MREGRGGENDESRHATVTYMSWRDKEITGRWSDIYPLVVLLITNITITTATAVAAPVIGKGALWVLTKSATEFSPRARA